MLVRALTLTATATIAASASIILLSAAAAGLVSSVVDVMAPPTTRVKKSRVTSRRRTDQPATNPKRNSSMDPECSRHGRKRPTHSRSRTARAKKTPVQEYVPLVEITPRTDTTSLEKGSLTSTPSHVEHSTRNSGMTLDIPSQLDSESPFQRLSPTDETPGIVIVSPLDSDGSESGDDADAFFSVIASGATSPYTHNSSTIHPLTLDAALLGLMDRQGGRSDSASSTASDESWATAA